jgi:hypothetical protein
MLLPVNLEKALTIQNDACHINLSVDVQWYPLSLVKAKAIAVKICALQ